MTLTQVRDRILHISKHLHFGCGNNECLIVHPKGAGTDAICTLTPNGLARDLRQLAAELDTMREWEKK